MKSLTEYVTEARVAKMNRKKFIEALASYATEQKFTKIDNDDDFRYKSYPKENTVMVKDNSIEFFYDDGKALRICNYYPNNKSKNLMKVEASSYNDKGYKKDNYPINMTGGRNEYFDISKLSGEEANEIIDKIKTLINSDIMRKVFNKWFKMSKNGYEKKPDTFNDYIIKYEDIK